MGTGQFQGNGGKKDREQTGKGTAQRSGKKWPPGERRRVTEVV